MKVSWGKGLASLLKSQNVLKDYEGVSDTDLEMSYIE